MRTGRDVCMRPEDLTGKGDCDSKSASLVHRETKPGLCVCGGELYGYSFVNSVL